MRCLTRALALSLMALATGTAACQGCRSTPGALTTSGSSSGVRAPATVRIYVLSNLAGALEPCGCTKDQLGGIDRLGAYLSKEKGAAQAALLLAAGPTAFGDTKLEGPRATQDEWKAETLAGILGDLGLAAWIPGYNDWAGGAPLLARLSGVARAPLVASNLKGEGASSIVGTVLREIAGVRIGIVGVSSPTWDGALPSGVAVDDPVASMKAAASELKAKGADILIGAAALPRGEALRLADAVPSLSVLVVGKPVDRDETNDATPAPQLVGSTLVVDTSNHLQTVGVVDLFVRNRNFVFQDGTGIRQREEAESVGRRAEELAARLQTWQKEGTVSPADLEARKADLARLTQRRASLAAPPAPPAEGSYFRYELVELRDSLGRDSSTLERMRSYYRRVNDHNRQAFADRTPPPVEAGQSRYVGVAVCTNCHREARQVWNKTQHAGAYETLATEYKEYNLECIGCHVTGYEKPGGSTVTVNEPLRGVQCETCHGPGEAHAKAPTNPALNPLPPDTGICAKNCHHPPHVDGFDAAKKLPLVLGPGHGMPEGAAPPKAQ